MDARIATILDQRGAGSDSGPEGAFIAIDVCGNRMTKINSTMTSHISAFSLATELGYKSTLALPRRC